MASHTMEIAPLGALESDLPLIPSDLAVRLRARLEATADEEKRKFVFDAEFFQAHWPIDPERELCAVKPKPSPVATSEVAGFLEKLSQVLNKLPNEKRVAAVEKIEKVLTDF